jgi:hypothetical protein
MAQLKNPPAPVSKTVQRLLAQIHAEAQAATLEALSAKDGIVTLQDIDRQSLRVSCDGDQIRLRDDRGSRTFMIRHRYLPAQWVTCPEIHHPAYWHVYEDRVDGNGVSWSRESQTMVADDFGNLVSVEGGAR